MISIPDRREFDLNVIGECDFRDVKQDESKILTLLGILTFDDCQRFQINL
jgi:hypothetical protein